MSETSTPNTKQRRKNVVSIELSEEGMALAVLLQKSEEQLVADAVSAYVNEMTAMLRGTLAK